jgi:L-methionine (R)-S-oxide reductase
MVGTALLAIVQAEADRDAPRAVRAQRIADVVREWSGRRWVGVYAVEDAFVRNLAWSGPEAPAHPVFPVTSGLTGAAIASRRTVISNDVASDPRYLTALESTGSEMIIPVVIRGQVIGTIDVEDERTDAFGRDDQALFEQVAEALTPLYDD